MDVCVKTKNEIIMLLEAALEEKDVSPTWIWRVKWHKEKIVHHDIWRSF
jgi:hypothetical protein